MWVQSYQSNCEVTKVDRLLEKDTMQITVNNVNCFTYAYFAKPFLIVKPFGVLAGVTCKICTS